MNEVAERLRAESAALAAELVSRATAARVTVATAESLTAGLIAATIADVPGASAVLCGGVVSYAVGVKHDVLGVDAGRLASHGPVDDVVAEQMAAGAARVCRADLGVSTTGVAGPEPHGGAEVGTVYLGFARGEGARTAGTDDVGHHRRLFPGDRDAVRWASVKAALGYLLAGVETIERKRAAGA